MPGYIYLISELDNDNMCKIGMTKRDKMSERLTELQTGNKEELYVRHKFKTTKPSVLEGMLHRHYASKSVHGEWFNLSDEEASMFPDVCRKYQDVIDSLEENPFF